MFPISDANPTRRFPIVTYALIGLNILVFIWQSSLGESGLEQAFRDLAIVPRNISQNPFSLESFLDIVRATFMHGGIEHIFGNMLYLYLFGDNIEDRLGIFLYLVVYFLSAFAAAAAQIIIDPQSTIPMIGASGAIAGVLGGYLIMFPGVKVRGIMPIGRVSTIQEWPAFLVLGMWFVLQLFNGIASLGPEYQSGGVAFFAHIGGFIAGAVLVYIFNMIVPQPPADERNQMLYRRAQS